MDTLSDFGVFLASVTLAGLLIRAVWLASSQLMDDYREEKARREWERRHRDE